MCLYRIRAPSYFVDNETPQGLMLHYRSKRRGFTTYTIGQLKAVAETYYKMEVAIEVKESEIKFLPSYKQYKGSHEYINKKD